MSHPALDPNLELKVFIKVIPTVILWLFKYLRNDALNDGKELEIDLAASNSRHSASFHVY